MRWGKEKTQITVFRNNNFFLIFQKNKSTNSATTKYPWKTSGTTKYPCQCTMLINNDYEIEKTMYVEPNVDTMMKFWRKKKEPPNDDKKHAISAGTEIRQISRD